MAEKSIQLSLVGEELTRPNLNIATAVAALADDRVLAELLRLAPFDGGAQGVYKAVLGYSSALAVTGQGSSPAPVVVPSGSANGSVLVRPFRAVVGSRNAVNAAPSPNPTSDTNSLANWRDIRSGIYADAGNAIATTLAFAANSSGSPRWDLVYATLAVDAGQNTVTLRVKDPNTGSISTPSVSQYVASPVSVQILQGTPAATPTPPPVPADSAGNYNIPLAQVRIPNGFGATSTIVTTDIRSWNQGNGGQPTTIFDSLASGLRMRAASGNNDGAGTYAVRDGGWNAAAGGRAISFLPPDWVGGGVLIVEWSANLQNGDIIDDSRDWRNRVFLSFVQLATGSWWQDIRVAGSGGNPGVPFGNPLGGGQSNTIVFGSSNTFSLPPVVGNSGYPAVLSSSGPNFSAISCDINTGKLVAAITGSNTQAFVWMFYSPQYPNL